MRTPTSEARRCPDTTMPCSASTAELEAASAASADGSAANTIPVTKLLSTALRRRRRDLRQRPLTLPAAPANGWRAGLNDQRSITEPPGTAARHRERLRVV